MGNDDSGHIVLIDMDNTLVDYDSEYKKRWRELAKSNESVPHDVDEVIDNRQHFEILKNFPSELHGVAREVVSHEDFFRVLQPFEGAIEALREMHDAGLHVKLCTSPSLFQYESCAASKFAWVRAWLGEEWLPHLIITRDKTVVRGGVLIDDKPHIKGACANPEWSQIYYEMPYNVDIKGKPRITKWSEWRSVLAPFYPQLEG